MVGDLNVADDGLETAAAWGKDRGHEVSERVRWICGAMRCLWRSGELQARPAAQRQRFLKMGEAMEAWFEEFLAVCSVRNWKTSARGKLCCSAREMLMPLSVAAPGARS